MVYLGADHNGFPLKEALKQSLLDAGVPCRDLGPAQPRAGDDYPRIAFRVAQAVRRTKGTGILFCGSGNGMAMAANRVRGIRAALAPTVAYARKARTDEDANILVLPAWWVRPAEARRIVQAWRSTRFAGAARHRRRIRQLDHHGTA